MELPRHGQLQNTRFNVGSFMCAAANSGAKDRLEWVIGLPSGVEQLEYRNNSGQTPLQIACSKGHKDCIEVLLENGADLDATAIVKGETVTCLKLAKKGGHTEAANFIEKCLDEKKQYGYCLAKLKKEIITICSKPQSTREELVRLGQLTKIFKSQTTKMDMLFSEPLIISACKAGNLELIEHMVNNLYMTHYSNDREGSNMLHISIRNKSDMRFNITECYPDLLCNVDTHGRIPLHLACANNDMKYVKWLFDLVLIERKPKKGVTITPPTTPMKVGNPPLFPKCTVLEEAVVKDEVEEDSSASGDSLQDSGEEIVLDLPDQGNKGIPTSLSSSEVKLMMEDLEDALPTGPPLPVTYEQNIKSMKLYSVDTEGENILHVLVKNNYHHLLEYILKTYPQFGPSPVQRDFWIRAEHIHSPIDEAITRGYGECLDILIQSIILYTDPTSLYRDDTLLMKATISNHFSTLEVLIRHGVHAGLLKAICVAGRSDSLPLILFYGRVVDMIKDGKQYIMENSAVLDWKDYFLPVIQPLWIKLASDAVSIVQSVFSNFSDLTPEAMIKQIGPSVMEHYLQHINDPIKSLNLKCFRVIHLCENEIESVPEELFSLPCLNELNLSSNHLHQLPAGPAGTDKCHPCKCLKVLHVCNNSLTTLPSWLFLLPKLEVVNASSNKIVQLPITVWISSSLLTLNLNKNLLSQLHDLCDVQSDHQTLKPKLDHLLAQLEYQHDLDSDDSGKRSSINQESGSDGENSSTVTYDEDTDFTTTLCNLKHLDLSHNKFTSVPKDLACLAPKLEKLFLNFNCISEMDLIKDFPTTLTALNIQSCGLKDTSIRRSRSLRCGDVYHLLTGTDSTAGYCEHCNHDYLVNLGSLNLKDNKLSSLQVANSNHHALFPALSVLDISNNQLMKVPDHLELLADLSSLNLSDNPITAMPFSISQLNQLWVINLDNLQLSNVPSAIVDSHSATELKNYLKHLHHKSQPYRRMKLMFVGESNKGKTSLLMALTRKGKVNHYQEIRLNVNRKPLSTVGVDLGDWEYAKQTGIMHAGKKITFMTWDFGGQEEYYATHQCFLSSHALYVLVWNIMDGDIGLTKLRPWLENIESRAMGAPVILVGTHVDLWDGHRHSLRLALEESLTKKFRELYIDCDRKQRRTYPKIMDKLFFVDTSNKDHINRLRDAIYDFALEYQPCSTGKKNPTPLLDELVPACYVSLEEIVRAIAVELRDKREIPILTHQEYMKHVSKLYDCARMNPTELKQATQFLHEKGILLHYDEGQLSDLYFVDPQWLCSMLAKVIAVPEVHSFHKNGFIGRNELGRILGSQEHTERCISLMEKFEVLFELGDSRYLIPSLLPIIEEESCVLFPRSLTMSAHESASKVTSLPAIPMGSHSNCLVRFFLLPFIPNGMFPRLSARLIATDVIDHVQSSLKVVDLVDEQQLINRPHWRVWRSGITMVWRHIQIFRIVPMTLPPPGIDVVHVIQPKELMQCNWNVYEGDSLMVQVDMLPDQAFTDTNGLQMATWLLQQTVEQINSVFEDWYEEFAWKRNIDINVVAADPCPQCMSVVYQHLAPDLFAAQKRLVDEPKALEEAKVKEKKMRSVLGSMTLHKSAASGKRFGTPDGMESQGTLRKHKVDTPPMWAPGRLYGANEKVLYLFSVKLSALSVMEGTALTCPAHGAINITQLAPDMIFADLALNIRVSPAHVTQKHYLDEGGFGVIFAASVKLEGGETQEVVIKTYTASDGTPTKSTKGDLAWHSYQSANTEGRIMASLQHPNILKLVGIALQPIRLLLEFAPLGSLKNVVNRYHDKGSRMSRYALQKVFSQVSSAMEYIHNKKIIYRDLKLANVLVFQFPDPHSPMEGRQHCKVLVKLTDYGISKQQVVYWGIRGMLGTPPYLPPEVILHGGKQAYTHKIDVYSFGMMLMYLFTYNKPFGKITRPLRAYLEAGLRPEMLPKHRPSCQWMYELMCWSWSSKPHHRPSFTEIRQIVLSEVFTRLHYAMKVEPSKHLVTAIAVRYYTTTPSTATNNMSMSYSFGHHTPPETTKHEKFSLQLSASNIQRADDENTEVYYGTDFGIVGVADLQQSSSSYKVVDDMKSPVTCMLMVNDHLWVGSHDGVRIFNTTTVNKQLVASWCTKLIVTSMILLPPGHYSSSEDIIMLTKSCSLVIFTIPQLKSQQLLENIEPKHEIKLGCELFCALLVPTINQLWVCTANSQLAVFSPGHYDNPEKYNMSDVSKVRCMATLDNVVLVAAEAKIQKWSLGEIPSPVSSLDCAAIIVKRTAIRENEDCHITSLLSINGMLYAGTMGGAIVAVDIAKMIVCGVLCVHSSPVLSLAVCKQCSGEQLVKMKRKNSLIINSSFQHDRDDEYLLINFALHYHGMIKHTSHSRPVNYNFPEMPSQCRYHQPTPTPNGDHLYMLLWSVHPW